MPRRADAAASAAPILRTPPPAPVPAVTLQLTRWHQAVLLLLLGGAMAVPVVISWSAYDHFRLPKQLTLYAVAICSVATAGVAVALRRVKLDDAARRALRLPALLGAAALTWGVITTLASTNVALSIVAMVWATSLVCIFVLAVWALRGARVEWLAAAILLPALVNATVLLLQAATIWNPWVFPEETYFRATKNALLGNADDVSVYLAAAALFAWALTVAAARRRAMFAVIAAYLTAAMLATEGLTAIGAFTAAAAVLLICWKPRLGLLALVTAPVALAAMLVLGPPRERVTLLLDGVRAGRWGGVLSGRLVPFATAWEMFVDRPLTGVGPGCFKFHYMRYRMELRDERPAFYDLAGTAPVNFAEVHNDHLQLLAETGVPGFAIMCAALVLVATRSRARNRGRPDSGRLARLLAAPLAVLLSIVMLAQFPLQLAASAYTYALLGAACLAWTADDVA